MSRRLEAFDSNIEVFDRAEELYRDAEDIVRECNDTDRRIQKDMENISALFNDPDKPGLQEYKRRLLEEKNRKEQLQRLRERKLEEAQALAREIADGEKQIAEIRTELTSGDALSPDTIETIEKTCDEVENDLKAANDWTQKAIALLRDGNNGGGGGGDSDNSPKTNTKVLVRHH